MKTTTIDSLKVDYTDNDAYSRMTYLLMPIAIDEDSVQQWCSLAKSNIAIITGFDWDNDLTPWPAPAVPAGTGDFRGLAPQLLKQLQQSVIPAIEGTKALTERNLIGVSLSGLFALWAWITSNTFHNVCSISGSFWYKGFVDWLRNFPIPKKDGAIFFELGTSEPRSTQPVFATVGQCTQDVIERLKGAAIDTTFEWVPGNHYSPIVPRLTRALEFLGKH